MASLVLGVVDVPYSNKGKGSAVTTSMVATFLEAKYHVMQHFVDIHMAEIQKDLVESAEAALEDLMAGAPMRDPFADATNKVKTMFSRYLMTGEIEGLGVPGVPTKAAENRRSLRFKDKESNGYRPSFIDTATYELSFRAWVKQ